MPAPLHGAAPRNPAGHSSGKGLAPTQPVVLLHDQLLIPRLQKCSAHLCGLQSHSGTSRRSSSTWWDPVPKLYGQGLCDLFGFLISILTMMEYAALVQNCPKALSVFLGNSHHPQPSAVPCSPRKGSHRIVWMFWGSVIAVIPVAPHRQAGISV